MPTVSRSSSFRVDSAQDSGCGSRRRLTIDQKHALDKLFESKSHPSKEEREALSVSIGM
jgi:hypothetical protein